MILQVFEDRPIFFCLGDTKYPQGFLKLEWDGETVTCKQADRLEEFEEAE